MTIDVVSSAFVAAGALALVIGPARQARSDFRESRELLEAIDDARMPEAAKRYLQLLKEIALPKLSAPWWARLLIRLAVPLGDFAVRMWPPRLLRQFRELRGASRDWAEALAEFAAMRTGEGDKALLVRAQLQSGMTWSIVLLGSSLVLVGALLNLISTIVR